MAIIDELQKRADESFSEFYKYAGEDKNWDYANYYLGMHKAFCEARDILKSPAYLDHEPLT